MSAFHTIRLAGQGVACTTLTRLSKQVFALLATCVLGCSHLHHGTHHERMPTTAPASVPTSIPRELQKATMPDYVIEPPDILSIDAVGVLVPKPPYFLRPLDVIRIQVEGTPEDLPIEGEFALEPDGAISLGPEYGSLHVGGLTVKDARKKIEDHLKKKLSDPQVDVTLQQFAGVQQVTGQHLVQPDGKVNLGTYGRVRVVGMTMEAARETIEAHLSEFLVDPEISVDVFAFNSKNYYIITQGGGLGDQVVSAPITGNETVLDAVSSINGMSQVSSLRIWIARPGGNECGGDQLLPVDWLAITQRGAFQTNYQLFPGDRLYIAQSKLVAWDNAMAKVAAPLERIMGFSLLGASTVRTFKFFNTQGGFGGGF